MIQRIALAVAGAAIVVLALWHPAPQPVFATAASSPGMRAPEPRRRVAHRQGADARAVVYVAGAVAKPGLYRLAPGARAADAVTAAGGMRPSADAAGVNLAEPVRDGDEVLVPAIGDAPRMRSRSRSRSRRSRSPGVPALALDVNSAAADQLAAVPGIGSALAARIVAMRAADGAFSTLDELLDVSGMTQSRLERARPYLLAR
jgi:competence protein ComEA